MMYKAFLYHHGVKGQQKGVRRYQNYDGTHTPLGRKMDRLRKSRKSKTRQPFYQKLDSLKIEDPSKLEDLKNQVASMPYSEIKQIDFSTFTVKDGEIIFRSKFKKW